MAYAPHVQRSGTTLYLPLPITARSVALDKSVSSSDAYFEQGGVVFSGRSYGEVITLNGMIVEDNPQDKYKVTSQEALWAKAIQLQDFFLKNTSLLFTLHISRESFTLGGGSSYPPYDTIVRYTDCVATSFSFDFKVETKFLINYQAVIRGKKYVA